ncbi:MAG: DDE-type integrase/transposase/recombinase [Verrucomicrobiota bacterium]
MVKKLMPTLLCRASAPNEIWKIDICEWIFTIAGRRFHLWLIVVLDVHTRYIVNVHISRATPTTANVLLAIRNAILNNRAKKGVWGKPLLIITDNGSVFTSKEYKRVLKSLSVAYHFIDKKSPWLNGHIERAVKTIKFRLAGEVPFLLGRFLNFLATECCKLNPEIFGKQIDASIQRMIKEYNQTVHRSTQQSPLDRWNQHRDQAYGIDNINPVEIDNKFFLLFPRRRIYSRDCVKIPNGELWYSNDVAGLTHIDVCRSLLEEKAWVLLGGQPYMLYRKDVQNEAMPEHGIHHQRNGTTSRLLFHGAVENEDPDGYAVAAILEEDTHVS